MATETQTARLPLAKAAIDAAAVERDATRRQEAQWAAQRREDDLATARYTVANTLGESYGEGVEWTLRPAPGYPTDRVAEATIDGLRFRVDLRSYDRNLYLLRQCPEHDPAEGAEHDSLQARIDGLPALGRALTDDAEVEWWCSTCAQRQHEQAEEGERYMPEPPPPTVAQRLLDVLGEYVEALISEHHADRI